MSDESKEHQAPYFPIQREENNKRSNLTPKAKQLANWYEDLITMQRVEIVLLIITVLMLLFHLFSDLFFHT